MEHQIVTLHGRHWLRSHPPLGAVALVQLLFLLVLFAIALIT